MSWKTVADCFEDSTAPANLLDAEGVLIDLPIVGFDLETGEVEHYIKSSGSGYHFEIDWQEGCCKRTKSKFKAPLKLVSKS